MRMPNSENSIVENKKIIDYLLNDNHEEGKHKSKFFKQFNFHNSDISQLQNSLINHSRDREIQSSVSTPFGTKYTLKCSIDTPDNRNPCIITVWIIENDENIPRLITAYPAK